jgi:hypothetical protein
LLNPTTRVEYLQEEYDITSYILSKNDFSLRNKMINIKDISKIKRQIVMKKISPKTIYVLYNNLKLIEEIFSVKDEIIMEYLNKREVDSNTIIYCREIIDFFDKTIDIQKCDTIDTLSQFEDNFILKGVDSYLDEKFKIYLESQDKLFAIKKFLNEKIKKFEKKDTDYIKIHETEKTIIRIVATKRRCSLLKEELSKDKRKKCILTYDSSFTGREESFELNYDNISFEKQNETNECIIFSQLNDICKNITFVKTNMKEIITNVYYQNIIEKFHKIIWIVIKSCDVNIIIIPLGITLFYPDGKIDSHANVLIYRKKFSHIEHFEPHGKSGSFGNKNLNSSLDLFLRLFVEYVNIELFKNKTPPQIEDIKPIELIESNQVCPRLYGFQVYEEWSSIVKNKEIESAGYCAAWSMFFTELCLKNPEMTSSQIITSVFSTAQDKLSTEDHFRHIIRGYSTFINEKISTYFSFLD